MLQSTAVFHVYYLFFLYFDLKIFIFLYLSLILLKFLFYSLNFFIK